MSVGVFERLVSCCIAVSWLCGMLNLPLCTTTHSEESMNY